MLRAFPVLLGLSLLALPSLANAQRGQSLLDSFDANTDGQLTQAEVDQARTARLAEFDANGDGQLSLEEYQALWLDAYRERMVDQFQRLDNDGDAIVTTEEFVGPFAGVVARLDANDDGQLVEDELRRRSRGRDHDRGGR